MQHCQRPLAPALAVFNFRIHRITFHDPERPEGNTEFTKIHIVNSLVKRAPDKFCLVCLLKNIQHYPNTFNFQKQSFPVAEQMDFSGILTERFHCKIHIVSVLVLSCFLCLFAVNVVFPA